MKEKNNQYWNIKDIAIAVFFLVMTVVAVRGLVVTENFEEGFEDIANNAIEAIKCEINYKEFYFNGLCSDKEPILDTIRSLYGGVYEIDNVGVCETGCLISFDEVKSSENTAGINGFMRNDCLKVCLEKYT